MRCEFGVLVANKSDGVVLRLRGSRGHYVPDLGVVYRRVFGLEGRVVDWRYSLWLRLSPQGLSLTSLVQNHAHNQDNRPHHRAANDEPEVVAGVWRDAGLDVDALMALIQTDSIKESLKQNTQAMADRGSFGVPTFFVGDEMFFGKERLGQIEEELKKAAV